MTDTERKAGMGAHMPTPELRAQVAAQYRAVAHMAAAIAEVHSQIEPMIGFPANDFVLNLRGERSAAFMEKLGDMLNGMDAVDGDADDWINPVIREAQRLWPQAQAAAHSDLKAALEECQKTLALLIDPKANRNISGTGVVNAFALCTKAEATARAALSKLEGGKAKDACPQCDGKGADPTTGEDCGPCHGGGLKLDGGK